jgi:hypothetical protein
MKKKQSLPVGKREIIWKNKERRILYLKQERMDRIFFSIYISVCGDK